MLSSRNYLATRLVGMRTPESRSNLQWPDIQVLSTEATGLLAKLKHQIYRHYRHIDEPEKTGVLVRTIKLLGGPRQPVVVFTTNYDRAVETFCRTHEFQLIDGFRHDPLRQSYFWSRDAFEDLSDSNLGKLVLFKLHGSTDWFKQGDRLFKGQSMYGADDPDYRHVMIYPATQKIAISEPYFTAYDYLVRCLDAAESCLVVGYSFRDYDTRMRFKSALLTNPSLKIVVLDPDAENLCKNLLDDNILAYPVPYPLDESQEPENLRLLHLQCKLETDCRLISSVKFWSFISVWVASGASQTRKSLRMAPDAITGHCRERGKRNILIIVGLYFACYAATSPESLF